MEFNFKSYGNSKQTISYCEVDKCPAVIKLREQLEAYKMEAEEGKEINAELKAENEKLREQLAEMISQSALLPKFFGLSAGEITQLSTKCSQLEQALRKIHKIAKAGYEGMCPDCSKKQCEENNCIEHAINEILVK